MASIPKPAVSPSVDGLGGKILGWVDDRFPLSALYASL